MKTQTRNTAVVTVSIQPKILKRLDAYAKKCVRSRSNALNALLDEVLPKETK